MAGLGLAMALGGRAAELKLIPLPEQVSQTAGELTVDARLTVAADAPLAPEADLLAEELHLARAKNAGDHGILLTTNGTAGLGEEAYQLEVNADGVIIRARTAAGAFYGGQTLRQLAGQPGKAFPLALPFVRIADAPRYEWRGLLLDTSRHFFDVATIRRLTDWMADYKLNRLHLHLTDSPAWRMEVAKYPQLTERGARGNFNDSNAPAQFYTRAELREIIAYAARRHIMVVPEIDMPGHADAATRTFPELDGGAHTFNPASEATYGFLQNVLRETLALFPSPYIHLGGDEVNRSGWEKLPAVAQKMRTDGLPDTQALEGQFYRRMAAFVLAQGRTPAGWDEVASNRPPAGTVVFWWRHNCPDSLALALAEGCQVVLTPRSPCYFDYPQDAAYPQIGWKLCNTPAAVYQGPAIPAKVPAARLKQVLGVEGCVWTERIATVPYLEFMTMPRLAALGEMAWTADGRRDYAGFTARMQPYLRQYQEQGIHFYDAANPAGSLHEARPEGGSGAKLSLSGN